MFDPTSRYYSIADTHYDAPDGRRYVYKKRRFPPIASTDGQGAVRVRDGDRLDTLATRALGDPLQFWRIADANHAMNPFDLVLTVGTALNVPAISFGVQAPL
jgi:nucleoid-associated protein YgaU